MGAHPKVSSGDSGGNDSSFVTLVLVLIGVVLAYWYYLQKAREKPPEGEENPESHKVAQPSNNAEVTTPTASAPTTGDADGTPQMVTVTTTTPTPVGEKQTSSVLSTNDVFTPKKGETPTQAGDANALKAAGTDVKANAEQPPVPGTQAENPDDDGKPLPLEDPPDAKADVDKPPSTSTARLASQQGPTAGAQVKPDGDQPPSTSTARLNSQAGTLPGPTAGLEPKPDQDNPPSTTTARLPESAAGSEVKPDQDNPPSTTTARLPEPGLAGSQVKPDQDNPPSTSTARLPEPAAGSEVKPDKDNPPSTSTARLNSQTGALTGSEAKPELENPPSTSTARIAATGDESGANVAAEEAKSDLDQQPSTSTARLPETGEKQETKSGVEESKSDTTTSCQTNATSADKRSSDTETALPIDVLDPAAAGKYSFLHHNSSKKSEFSAFGEELTQDELDLYEQKASPRGKTSYMKKLDAVFNTMYKEEKKLLKKGKSANAVKKAKASVSEAAGGNDKKE